jgi:pilus assembly protein CpaB
MNRGMRVVIVITVALIAASIATYAIYQGIQRIPVREVEVAGQPVVVAARALPIGAMVGPSDVKIATWPARSVVAGSFGKADDVVGRGLVVEIAENEPLTERKLAPREAGAGLQTTIPIGMRAVSVKVNEVIGVAGFVLPGTRVDLVATVGSQKDTKTRTVVSNLQVLASGTRYDQQATKEGKPIPSTVVTLLATPEDAERITLASTDGKILLVLRNPLDTEPTKTPGIRLDALMQSSSEPPIEKTVKGRKVVVAAPPPPPPPAPSPYMVEAIRGAKRTTEEVKK